MGWGDGLDMYGNYRLIMKNLDFGPYFFICHFVFFWALLGPNKGRGPIDTHTGQEPQNPIKKLAHL